MPKSTRKFIRREKSRIRRDILDTKKQKELINELYQKLLMQNENKRDPQSSDK